MKTAKGRTTTAEEEQLIRLAAMFARIPGVL